MQVLTLEGVKKAARRYYRAGKLTAQHPRREQRGCAYQQGQYRCAIGAALTKETLSKFDEFTLERPLSGISAAGLVKVKSVKLGSIQNAHDAWAEASREGFEKMLIAERKNAFLRLIGIRK